MPTRENEVDDASEVMDKLQISWACTQEPQDEPPRRQTAGYLRLMKGTNAPG